MNYGIEIKMNTPRQRKQIIPQDVMLFHLEKFWMAFYIFYELGANGKCFQNEYGSGSTCSYGDFNNGQYLKYFKNWGKDLLEVYDQIFKWY